MARIARAIAALRIMGDSLVPSEITSLLGVSPTTGFCKGQELLRASGIPRIAKGGMWQLQASDTSPADLDSQVREILARVSQDISVWTQLASRFDIDLFCGWFMEEEGEGLSISPNTLRELGTRGIELALNIYAGDKDARQIYVRLLGEGTEVWRPAAAAGLPDGTFILSNMTPVPQDERWEFPPGSRVVVEEKNFEGKSGTELVAIALYGAPRSGQS